MAAVCDIRCQTRDDFPDWHFNFPSWRDLLDMIQLKQRQRMGRWFVKYGAADAGTPDASTSGRQEAASGWQDSGSAHGRSGPALPSVKASCRTAAAVLGAQARRGLTAPGLAGAQGPWIMCSPHTQGASICI